MGALLARRPQRVWLVLLGFVVLVIAVAAVAVILGARSSPGGDHGERLALYRVHQRQTHETSGKRESEAGQRKGGEAFGREEEGGKADPDAGSQPSTREAAGIVEGREGGEGERHGANTPWAEQVANRAYPRSYVDDHRALAGRHAFDRVPAKAGRSSFATRGEFDASRAAAPGHWTLLGPVTPNVS